MGNWCWTPNAADKKRIKKGESIARKNAREIISGGNQYIGRPQGPKAKGHKTPATGILPYTRFSVLPK